ncbi:MAG: FAD-dependent oxidoreductase [Alphaproteobacteria bacterium]|nr:FAD-dependent oxidoreductase [Alphaproteobacteria bacterium]
MENNRTYHIIGAGIAGLFAAKLIKEKHPLSTVLIYEAAEKIGGRCGSFFDSEHNCMYDNATHVILNCNRQTKKLINSLLFKHTLCFWDFKKKTFISKLCCIKEIILAIFNTAKPNFSALLYVIRHLLHPYQLKAYFSTGDLSNLLCDPLLIYANDIKYGYVWQGVEINQNRITKLRFNKETITIDVGDMVISAIDSYHYNKIVGGYDFDYNAITNIFYRTSMALTFPQNKKMFGLKNALSQWIFSTPNYTAVTISNSPEKIDSRSIWQEICCIRNYNSAFEPYTRIQYFPYATIRQDKKNNAKRPTDAQTAYNNLLICGDWTMKNRPCCIETAIQSALRLLKYL